MLRQVKKYTPYYRVSTRRQATGLSLEVQRDAVLKFIDYNINLLEGEFREVESGGNNNRAELEKAIQYTKENGTTLLVANLDRLSRNTAFIFRLQEEQVDFVCCDMPDANTLTIGFLAIMAQYEREMIASRIKGALGVLKKRGVKLGNPQNLTQAAREKAWAANSQKALDNENNKRATGYIKQLRQNEMSYQTIANQLNREGFKTARGKKFTASAVRKLYLR